MTQVQVVYGDTLTSIAQKHYGAKGTDEINKVVDALVQKNNIGDKNLIFAGKSYELPEVDGLKLEKTTSGGETSSAKDSTTEEKTKGPSEQDLEMNVGIKGDNTEELSEHRESYIKTNFLGGKEALNAKEIEQKLKDMYKLDINGNELLKAYDLNGDGLDAKELKAMMDSVDTKSAGISAKDVFSLTSEKVNSFKKVLNGEKVEEAEKDSAKTNEVAKGEIKVCEKGADDNEYRAGIIEACDKIIKENGDGEMINWRQLQKALKGFGLEITMEQAMNFTSMASRTVGSILNKYELGALFEAANPDKSSSFDTSNLLKLGTKDLKPIWQRNDEEYKKAIYGSPVGNY